MKITRLLGITDVHDFKVHAARSNGQEEPLDVFVRDREAWEGWNAWRRDKNEFNRRFILSLIRFHPEYDTWLFGGIYEVLERGDVGPGGYKLQLSDQGAEFIGRLKVCTKISRGRAFLLSSLDEKLLMSEVLRDPYAGEAFPGYEKLSIYIHELESVFDQERSDWKAALQNIKGIYVIADRETGRKYVGSASGEHGIWSRWHSYVKTGHGHNKELIELLENRSAEHARKNFRITLIEWYPTRTDDNMVFHRESFWKEALLTRGEHGYNAN